MTIGYPTESKGTTAPLATVMVVDVVSVIPAVPTVVTAVPVSIAELPTPRAMVSVGPPLLAGTLAEFQGCGRRGTDTSRQRVALRGQVVATARLAVIADDVRPADAVGKDRVHGSDVGIRGRANAGAIEPERK